MKKREADFLLIEKINFTLNNCRICLIKMYF